MSMTSKRSETVKAIARFLEDHNVNSWRYEHAGKHPRIVVNHAGREVFVTIPGTSSNWRTRYYAITDLRRVLGLREVRP
jgi:hypothetical protein